LEDGLAPSQVNAVVFISSRISRNLLVGRIPPLPVHSKLVLILSRLQESREHVSWHILAWLIGREAFCLDRLAWDDLVHLFALPAVELGANFDNFSPEVPFEDVFDFRQQLGLLLSSLGFFDLLLIFDHRSDVHARGRLCGLGLSQRFRFVLLLHHRI